MITLPVNHETAYFTYIYHVRFLNANDRNPIGSQLKPPGMIPECLLPSALLRGPGQPRPAA